MTEPFNFAAKGLMTLEEACDFLACSNRTLYRIMNTGLLSFTMVCRARRIPRLSLEKFILENTKGPDSVCLKRDTA